MRVVTEDGNGGVAPAAGGASAGAGLLGARRQAPSVAGECAGLQVQVNGESMTAIHVECLALGAQQGVFGEVAALHCAYLPIAFITSLGELFVAAMYRGIAAAPQSCVLIASDGAGRVVGFVAGTASSGAMFRWILPRHGLQLLFRAAAHAWSPAVVRHATETAAYLLRQPERAAGRAGDCAADGAGTAGSPVAAELLSIAVGPSARGAGVGRQLVLGLEAFLRERGCRQYRVATDAEDRGSNAFYQRTGFTLRRSFRHHGRPMNEYAKAVGGLDGAEGP